MAAILAFGVVGAAAAYPQTGYFDIGEDCFLDSSGKQDITMRNLLSRTARGMAFIYFSSCITLESLLPQ